jgi:hypothetical protein
MPDRRPRPPDLYRRRAAWMCTLTLALGSGIPGAGAAAPDANERRFIREGMAEGEVLLRIGRPDHEAMVRQQRGEPEEKTWTYFPAPRDPQTLTILTLRAGTVAAIERKIQR